MHLRIPRALTASCRFGQPPRTGLTGVKEYTSKAPQDVILTIPKANVYRFGDPNTASPVFRDLEWSVNEGESWAIIGSGSGEKTSFFQVGGLLHLLCQSIERPPTLHSPISTITETQIPRCFWATYVSRLRPHRPQAYFLSSPPSRRIRTNTSPSCHLGTAGAQLGVRSTTSLHDTAPCARRTG